METNGNGKLGKILKTITAIATALAALVGLGLSIHTATATFQDKAAGAGTDQNKVAIEKISRDIEKNREEIRTLYREMLAVARTRQPITVSVPRIASDPSASSTRSMMRSVPRSIRPRLTPPERLFKKKVRELPKVEQPKLKSYEQIQEQLQFQDE